MAALPIIPDVYRCFIRQRYLSVELGNVVHVRVGGTATPDEVARVVADSWGLTSVISLMQSATIQYIEVQATKLDGTSAVGVNDFGTANHKTGQTPGAILAMNTACCIAIKTGLRGRTARGRMYVAGMVAVNTDDSLTWIPAFKAQALGAAIAFEDNLRISNPSCVLGVASYKAPASFLAWDHFVVNNGIATQRKRLQ